MFSECSLYISFVYPANKLCVFLTFSCHLNLLMLAEMWPENNPDTLEDLCLQVCARNLDTFTEPGDDALLRLKPEISLNHPGLCDKLFVVVSEKRKSDLSWIGIFNDATVSRLTHANLSHQKELVPSVHLNFLKYQPITALDLTYCNLSQDSFTLINYASPTLKSLKIDDVDSKEISQILSKEDFETPLLKCTSLQRLTLRSIEYPSLKYYSSLTEFCLKTSIGVFRNLTHLDVSYSLISPRQMEWFGDFPNLLSLNLSCVHIDNMMDALQNICKASQLR